jgi:hypothetical protein
VVLAALTGCSSKQNKTQNPNDVVAAMNAELAHTIDPAQNKHDPYALMQVLEMDSAEAVGITTTTSTTLPGPTSPDILATPMPLPDSRMSLAQADDEAAPQTWGATPDIDLSELPDTRY